MTRTLPSTLQEQPPPQSTEVYNRKTKIENESPVIGINVSEDRKASPKEDQKNNPQIISNSIYLVPVKQC